MSRKKATERRGAFGGGMLQTVVNTGRSAKKRLEWDKQLTDEERKRLLRQVSDGESAEIQLNEHKKKFPEGGC